jgi:hypothetical protein
MKRYRRLNIERLKTLSEEVRGANFLKVIERAIEGQG